MAKSKFQAKAQVKVGVKSKVKKPKSKYYDEHISTSQSSKSNNGFAVFVIVCIIIGASVSGILIAINKQDEDPNGTSGSGIQDGDLIHFKYVFYIDWNHDKEFTNDEYIMNADDFEWIVEENSEQGFPPGLYYNILGMKVGDTKLFTINANVDINKDGIDDITAIPVWEGEDSFGQYNLQYYIEIVKIN